MPDIKTVTIKPNGRIADTDARKTLSINAGDKVKFQTLSGGPWTVFFPSGPDHSGTPFDTNTYTVSVGSPATTSAPTAGTAGTAYKYQVKNSSGTIVDDPDVLIEL